MIHPKRILPCRRCLEATARRVNIILAAYQRRMTADQLAGTLEEVEAIEADTNRADSFLPRLRPGPPCVALPPPEL